MSIVREQLLAHVAVVLLGPDRVGPISPTAEARHSLPLLLVEPWSAAVGAWGVHESLIEGQPDDVLDEMINFANLNLVVRLLGAAALVGWGWMCG